MRHPRSLGWSCLLVAALALLPAGCGQSLEQRQKQAENALRRNQPQKALEEIEMVLAQQPDNIDALHIKADAQTRLRLFDPAMQTMQLLLKKDESNARSRRLALRWCKGHIEHLIGQSDFTNPSAKAGENNAEKLRLGQAGDAQRQRVEDSLRLGVAQAAWLREHAQAPVESDYELAQFAGYAAAAQTKLLMAAEARLDPEAGQRPASDEDPESIRAQIEKIRQARREKLDEQESYLLKVLQADPVHPDAGAQYVRLLIDREGSRWQAVEDLARKVSTVQNLPVEFAATLIEGLARRPEAANTLAQRLELGWQLLRAVDPARQKATDWIVSAARLHLMGKAYQEARGTLQPVVERDANHHEARYLLALALMNLKDLKAARDHLQRLDQARPRNPQTKLLYGKVLADLRDSLAASVFQQVLAIKEATPAQKTEAQVMLAQLEQTAGHRDPAAAHIDQAYAANPADPRVLRLKMANDRALGRPEEIRKVLEKAGNIQPQSPEILAVLVEGWLGAGDPALARKYAQEWVALQPDRVESHLAMVAAAMSLGDKEDSIRAMLEEIRAKFPGTPGPDQTLAQLYLARNRFDLARAKLQGLLEKEPDNKELRLLMARALNSLSMHEQAFEQLETVLDKDPNDPDANALAFRLAFALGDWARAEDHLSRIRGGAAEDRMAADLKAFVLIRQAEADPHSPARDRKLDEAAELCTRALALGRDEQNLRLLLARVYELKQQLQGAEDQLLSLVRTYPNSLPFFVRLGQFYVQHKRVNDGLVQLAKLESASFAMSRLTQADLLLKARDFERAREKMEPVVEGLVREKSPLAVVAAELLAQSYLGLAKAPEALAVYDRLIQAGVLAPAARLRQINMASALRLDSRAATEQKMDQLAKDLTVEHAAVRLDLIRRFLVLRLPEKALALVDQWLAEKPDSTSVVQMRADLLWQLGRRDEAFQAMVRATELAPDSVPAWQRLARRKAELHDYPGAEKVYEQAAARGGAVALFALADLGELYMRLGLNQQANAAFARLEKTSVPNDSRVLYIIGRTFANLKQPAAARAKLEAIRPYAPTYAAAQILLAQLDRMDGKMDAASKRLDALVANRENAAQAAEELLGLSLRDREMLRLVRASAAAVASVGADRLAPALRKPWLAMQIAVLDRQQQWKPLMELLRAGAASEPDNVTWPAGLALLHLVQGEREQARQVYANTPDINKQNVGLLVAAALGESPKPERAVPAWVSFALALARGDVDAARQAAREMPAATTVFKPDLLADLERPDITAADSRDAARTLCLAWAARELQLLRLCAELAGQVVKTKPTLVLAQGLRLQAHMEMDEDVEAVSAAVIRQVPQSYLAQFVKATQAMRDSRFDQAVPLLRQLVERNPRGPLLRTRLATALEEVGQMDEAIAHLDQVYADPGPDHVLVANHLAFRLAEFKPQRLEEAYKIAKAAHELAPTLSPLLDTLGWIEHLRGQHAQAITYLNRCAAVLGGEPEVQYHLGAVYQALGNRRWARYHLTEAVKAPPANARWLDKAKAMLASIPAE